MPRSRLFWVVGLFLFAWAISPLASAEPRLHQAPTIVAAHRATRVRAIRRVRRQRIGRSNSEGIFHQLKDMPTATAEFRELVSQAPLRVRLGVFKHKVAALKAEKLAATSDDGQRVAAEQLDVPSFDRRLRGMVARNQRIFLLPFLESAGFFTTIKGAKDQNNKQLRLLSLIEGGALTINGKALDVRVQRDENGKTSQVELFLEGTTKARVVAKSVGDALRKLPLNAKAKVELAYADHGAVLAGTATEAEQKRITRHAAVARERVSSPQKTFFEVYPDTLKLFQEVMGQNLVWFAVNSSPNHLHTLLADQGDGGSFHHNTYGTVVNDAEITGNYTQFVSPVVLTDSQMERFVRYINAGVVAEGSGGGKNEVYGFFSGGKKITEIKCTNWATSAPVGDLPRWVQSLDKRLKKDAAAGRIHVPQTVAEKGLHAALAEAGTPEARRAVVDQVLANANLSTWTRKSVKNLGHAFKRELEGNMPALESANQELDAVSALLAGYQSPGPGAYSLNSKIGTLKNYVDQMKTHINKQGDDITAHTRSEIRRLVTSIPEEIGNARTLLDGVAGDNAEAAHTLSEALAKHAKSIGSWYTGFSGRPHDLVLRKSLAEILGLNRAQDPAKWSYDLMMSNKAPVVAVFNRSQGSGYGYVAFGPTMQFNMEIMGLVEANGHVIMSGSGGSVPNAGALGVVPEYRRPSEPAHATQPETTAAAPVAGTDTEPAVAQPAAQPVAEPATAAVAPPTPAADQPPAN